MDRSQVINLAAGPSGLPREVLEEAAVGLLNYEGTGIGLTELSHRSPEFSKLTKDLASGFRTLLDVPETHDILFTQGGGSAQFSAVVLNLLARHRLKYPDLKDEERSMDYIVTGTWSDKAAQEAKRLGGGTVNIVTDARNYSPDKKSFESIPPVDEWKFSTNPAFVYYCENETVNGVQFSGFPSDKATAFPISLVPADASNPNSTVPLIGDFSSSFLSRPIPNLSSYALIYAGAQKNIGPAGLTILIIRKDLLVDTVAASKLGSASVPTTMDYAILAKSGSLYNTPPMFSMYVSLLVLRHFTKLGGAQYLAELNAKKAKVVYSAVEEAEKKGVLKARVLEGSRSCMNVVFDVIGEGEEARFLAEAVKRGFRGVKGHRWVRASK
jgi:phosphoserine aminotransferase